MAARFPSCVNAPKMINFPLISRKIASSRKMMSWICPFATVVKFDISRRNISCRSIIAAHTFDDFNGMKVKKVNIQKRALQTLPNSVKTPGDREIENHLRRLRLPFRNGYTSVVAPCPTCKMLNIEEQGTRDSKTWNLFINKMTGKFICKKCGHSGLWNEIKVIVILTMMIVMMIMTKLMEVIAMVIIKIILKMMTIIFSFRVIYTSK